MEAKGKLSAAKCGQHARIYCRGACTACKCRYLGGSWEKAGMEAGMEAKGKLSVTGAAVAPGPVYSSALHAITQFTNAS